MPGKQINPRYYHFHPTIPIATPASAPISTTVDVGALVVVEEIRVIIPAGHAGLTGVRLDYAGQTILPWGLPAGWLIGNDSDWLFDMGYLEVGAGMTIVGYNTDGIAHGFDVTFKVRDITSAPNVATGARAAVIL